MYSQPLTRTRRVVGLGILAIACAGTTGAAALACPAAPGFPGDPGGGRAVQQHALTHAQTKAAFRVVCTRVYPLSCHATARQ